MNSKTGFIIGKFYPFHTGHEKLAAFARCHCDRLIILVCASDTEKLSGEKRAQWIRDTYRSDPGIEVRSFSYSEKDLPNTSVSSRDVSKVWAQRLKVVLPSVDLIFTAEDYGDYVAEFMGITHIRYDKKKEISATLIRGDIQRHWDSINSKARPDLVKKIAIVGTESTGKTTLAQFLAQQFNAALVSEAGRDIVEKSAACTEENLLEIASTHTEKIREQLTSARRLLIMDTDITITKSYSRFLFNRELRISDEMQKINRADLYLYMDADAPFVQDGTRLDENARNKLDKSHRKTFDEAGINYIVLSGTFEEKYQKAQVLVAPLLPSGL